MQKHLEHLNQKKIWIVNFVSFLLGFSDAVLIYVISSYFKLAFGTENVSIFYFLSYGILFLSLLNLHRLAGKIGNANIFFIALFFKIIAVAFLIGLNPGAISIFFLILYIIFVGVGWVSLDAVLENFSCDRESGRIRGKHLMIMNAGFLFGPFLSAYLLSYCGFSGIFVFLVIFNILIFIYSLVKLRKVNSVFKRKISASELIRKVIRHKKVLAIYHISFTLEFFYALMIIYTPLYLLDMGMSWEQIGKIFTVMLLPFVFLQYPMGILADGKNGEKRWLIVSLFLMAFFTIAFCFIQSANILIWACILFGTRVGAAMLEVLRDSYFYKQIDGGDIDLIDFFRTAMPVGYILAAFFSFIILLVLPLIWIFVFLALVILLALRSIFYLSKK